MKITSASKKVLASALSAAMVVAFAPTVAFAADAVPADAVASFTYQKSTPVEETGGTVTNKITTETFYFTLSDFAGDVNAAFQAALTAHAAKTITIGATTTTLTSPGSTITLHTDVAGNFTCAEASDKPDTFTLDLGGNTLTNDGYQETGDTLTLGAGDVVTLKNGTINAVKKASGASNTAVTGGTVSVYDGTYGAINSDVVTILDGTFNGKVTDKASTGMVIKNGTFNAGVIGATSVNVTNATIKASNTKDAESGNLTKGDATALKAGTVTVTGNLDVQATVSGSDASAIAVDGNLTVSGDKAVVTVAASAAGADDTNSGMTNTPNATAIKGKLTNTGKSSVTATAEAFDDVATAIAAQDIDGAATLKATVAGEYEDQGTTSYNAYALNSKTAATGTAPNYANAITGGTYTGKIAPAAASTTFVKGGTFTQNIHKTGADYLLTGLNLDVIDDGAYYTVYKKVADNNASQLGTLVSDTDGSIAAAVADAVENVANGDAASNVVYAEGKTATDLKAAIEAGKIAYTATAKAYKAKTATDAEKANFAAIEELAKASNSYASELAAFTLSIELNNGKTGAEKVVYGYLTNLGQNSRGVARTVNILAGAITTTGVEHDGDAVAMAVDGKASTVKLEAPKSGIVYTVGVNDCGMYTWTSLSQTAINDAANKGEEAVEKATQGIDVSQKSRTVKLAKGKTKTQKALYFKMGASAETALTTAKKSGSSRITVSGDKVTLKKGTKKGTYTAKVSLKAAGSAEYLAAAKTITVKFVVKK